MAAEQGYLEVVRILLDSGIRHTKETLTCAIRSTNMELVMYLLHEGVNVDTAATLFRRIDKSRVLTFVSEPHFEYTLRTPYSEAIRIRNTQLLLNSGANSNFIMISSAQIRGFETPLGIAIEQGDLPLIKDLLSAGAAVNYVHDDDQVTALSLAIRSKNMEVIQLLLDNGANVSSLGRGTPLVAAIESGVIEMIDSLLERGADPADKYALLLAMSQSTDLVQRLLRSFAKRYPYGKGDYGSEALSRAVKEQNLPLVQALLQPNIGVGGMWYDIHGSRKYKTPLAIAIEGNDEAVAEMLLSKVSDLNRVVRYMGHPYSKITERLTALLVAVSVGNPQMIQLLISRGANLNLAATGGVDRTPLQMAAEKGHLAVVQLLIEKGAEVNALPAMKEGGTALQLATIGGYIGIAEELLRQGASLNAPGSNIFGRTALEGAAEHGRIDMVQYLLNARAEITGSGYHQYAMAMQYAKENGHGAICELLESAAGSNGMVLTLE